MYSREQLERDLAAVERLDSEISAKVARGEISGWDAVRLGRECQKKIASLRMKLVNAGQLIADLRAAKAEVAIAESQTEEDRAQARLHAAWNKIRWNSDGRISDAAQDTDSRRSEAPRSREIDLDSPGAQAEVKAAQIARKRVLWRPGGRNVVVIFED